MKKFFEFVGYLVLILIMGFLSCFNGYLIFVKHEYDFINWFCFLVLGVTTLLSFVVLIQDALKTPKTETNIDKPKESDDVVVTEIQGERNIIIDVVVKIIVFFVGLVLTGFLISFLRYLGLSGVIITILGLLPLILAIKYCFTTNDKDKDKE